MSGLDGEKGDEWESCCGGRVEAEVSRVMKVAVAALGVKECLTLTEYFLLSSREERRCDVAWEEGICRAVPFPRAASLSS